MERNRGGMDPGREGAPDWRPYEILNRLDNFEGHYGIEGIWNFCDKFEAQIKKKPNKVHILGLIGEPVSGKSVTQWQILSWILRGDGEIAKLVQDHGYQVRIDNIPWGDTFFAIPDGLRQNSSMSPNELQNQLNRAEFVFRHSLIKTIQGYYKDPYGIAGIENPNFEVVDPHEKLIRILTFDIPAFTGMYISDSQADNFLHRVPIFRRIKLEGDQVGKIRALRTISELIHKSGIDFGPFKSFYETPFIIGLVASHQIRTIAKKERERMAESNSEEEKRKVFEEFGIILQTDTDVLGYGKEDASVADIEQMERDLNITIELLQSHGLMPSTFYCTIRNRWLPLTAAYLRAFPEDRARVIGEHILPYFCRQQIQIPEKRVGIFFNNTYLKFIHLYREIEQQHFPVRELHNIQV